MHSDGCCGRCYSDAAAATVPLQSRDGWVLDSATVFAALVIFVFDVCLKVCVWILVELGNKNIKDSEGFWIGELGKPFNPKKVPQLYFPI